MRQLLLVVMLLGTVGCSALRDDLRRAERAFDDARYEEVLVWLAALERELPDMDGPLRAKFYYLRGATAYRIEQRLAARHYLALCREQAGNETLREDWRRALEQMLIDVGGSEQSSGGYVPLTDPESLDASQDAPSP